MTFYDKKDLSKLISHYEFKDDKYIVEYLDGDYVKYYNSNKDHYKELNEKMLKQAISRDKDMYKFYKKLSNIRFIFILMSAISVGFIFDSIIISIICLVLLTLQTGYDFIPKYNELEKYHDYLEIEEKLKNNYSILKELGYDTIYDIPLDINTLDYYSNRKINKIKKYVLKNN